MTQTPHILHIATLLYGPHYQRPLAQALDVSPRLIRYWSAGRGEPAPAHWARLRAVFDARLLEMEAVEWPESTITDENSTQQPKGTNS